MIRWTTYVCWRTSVGSIFRNHWWSSLFTNHMYSTMALLISCAFAENKGYNWKCWSGGGFKSQSFKKKLWSKLEFLEGWEGSNQKCSVGGVFIFSWTMHFAAIVMYPCDQFWQEEKRSIYLHIQLVLMKMKPKLPARYEGKLFILKSKLFLCSMFWKRI